MAAEEQGMGLRFLMRVIGYASEKIARRMVGRGAHQLYPSEGFIVKGREGPLEPAELARARKWGKSLENFMEREKMSLTAA